MNFTKLKQIARILFKSGKNRIKINTKKLPDEFKPEYTRNAVKQYFKEEILTIKPIKGTTRHSEKKCTKNLNGKRGWIIQVRRLRQQLRQNKNMDNKKYRQIYLKIKANIIKTRKQAEKLINDKLQKKI